MGRHLLIASLIYTLLPTTLLHAQTGTVTGVVSIPGASDWSGVTVALLSQNRSTTTTSSGEFTFANVVAGPIAVQAGKLYYANDRIDTLLAGGQTLSLSLSLSNNIIDTMISQHTPRFITGITNNGNIGALNHFVDVGDPGFTWSGQQHLFEASLMIGVDTNRVSDAARFIMGMAQQNLDQDFQALSDIVLLTDGPDSTVTLTAFNDSRANLPPGVPSQPLGVLVSQKTYSFGDALNNGFLIIKLTLTNTSTVTIQNMIVGWFVDWDVEPTYNTNRGGVLFVDNTIPGINGGQPFTAEIVHQRNATIGTMFTGIVPLSQPVFKASRITSNEREIYPTAPNRGLTEANKYRYMASRRDTLTHMDWGVEEDLSMVVSVGGMDIGSYGGSTFTLAPNESRTVGFAFVGGDDSASFVQNALQAQRKWVELGHGIIIVEARDVPPIVVARPFLEQNFPNPFNPATTLQFHLPTSGYVAVEIFNLLGQRVQVLYEGNVLAGVHQVTWDGSLSNGTESASGVYVARLTYQSEGNQELHQESRRIMLLR